MNKPNLMYFKQDDVLQLIISNEPEGSSVEIGPNLTAELNDKGELIGIEILTGSAFIRDWVLGPQAKMLQFAGVHP